MSEILLNYTRAGKVENIHRGDIVAVDLNEKVVDCIGDSYKKMFWRSAAKPFQAIPFVQQYGLEQYNITEEELALLVSSHSGETRHVELVRSILSKIGLGEEVLDCGPARPMNGRAAAMLTANKQKPQPVHNPCSGKHSGMLALCQLLGINIENYTKPQHQVQQAMHLSVANSAKLAVEEIEIGIDGCGVPVFYLPLYNMALAYARLAKPEEGEWGKECLAVEKINSAMRHYPMIISGTGRIDAIVSEITNGRIIAKIGADAVYCLSSVEEGIGVAFKIEDGSYQAINPTVIGILKRLGLVNKAEYEQLIEKFPPVLKNHRGDIIGTIETLF